MPLLVYWKDLPVGKQNGLSNHADIFSALMQTVFRVENPLMDYSQGRNLFDLKGDDWVLASNFRWNVVIQPDGTQYHIDRKGNYKNSIKIILSNLQTDRHLEFFRSLPITKFLL